MSKIKDAILGGIKGKVVKDILSPVNGLVDENLQDISTTIGSFIVRSVRGKFQRSISFTIGVSYSDMWMEEALYGILYKYNNIKGSSRLQLKNKKGSVDGSGMYYQLDDGTHNLKYRDYDILLCIQSSSTASATGRFNHQKIYTIITYDLSPEFVTSFEKDMIAHRNSLLKIKKDSPMVNVYKDYHEGDGYTYWEKTHTIPKRKLATIYMPEKEKRELVTSINEFFASKKYYTDHGIAHNLKILLYGPPGPQPVSARIPTVNGYRLMGDLKVGDKVFSRAGVPIEIYEIYEYDEEESIYEVEMSDHRKYECTIDHGIPIYSGIYGGVVHVSLRQLLQSSFIATPSKGSTLSARSWEFKPGALEVPQGSEAMFEYYDVPCDPWAMGYLIGAGYVDESGRLVIDRKHDRETDARMANEICNRLHIVAPVTETPGCPIDPIVIDPDAEAMLDYHFGMEVIFITVDGSNRKIISIPKMYMYNSPDIRMAFIQGIFDACGCGRSCSNGDVLQIRVNDSIAQDFADLMESMQYSVVYRQHLADERLQTLYVYSSMPRLANLFMMNTEAKQSIIRHQSILKFEDDSPFSGRVFIKRVRDTGRKEKIRCIHVADKEHLYQSTSYLMTCNSGKDSVAKMIASEWNRNIYYVTGGKDGKFIPNAIVDDDDDVNYPLILISDIDKYPYLISEPDINMEDASAKQEAIMHKQMFGSMINALDGVISGEDRIIVMTTNHIEKFSDTFLRDARVDIKMEIGYVTPDVFRKYTHDFYNFDLPADIELVDNELTVAKLQTDVVFRKLTLEEFIEKHVKKGK